MDAIDRQAAIDALNDEFTITGKTNVIVVQDYIRRVNNRLHDLPSAQPETHEERMETHACDSISRQAAIDAALKKLTRKERTNLLHMWSTVEVKYWVTELLENLPSAKPEIIRCKDCKHKHIENMVWVCPFGLPGGEEFFCGYGAEPYKGEQE